MRRDTSNKLVSKTKFVARVTYQLNNGVRCTYSKYVTAMHISGNGSAEPVATGPLACLSTLSFGADFERYGCTRATSLRGST